MAVFAGPGDGLAVSPSDDLVLTVSGPLELHAPAGPENLVMRAAELLRHEARATSGATIRLDKELPAGAGFGGGSSDAAAALLALNELWDVGLSREALARLGGRLGADMPMCLAGRAVVRARGIGDLVEPIPEWPPLPLVLVWPGAPVSTASVFGGLPRRDGPPLPDLPVRPDLMELAAWLAGQRNDLQTAAIEVAPVIDAALQEISETGNCLLARMSGSGSGCFGLYRSEAEAAAAAALIRRARPDWWVASAVAA